MALLTIRLRCDCGQKYEFDTETDDGPSTVEIYCPYCGVNGTALANDQIARLVSEQRSDLSPQTLAFLNKPVRRSRRLIAARAATLILLVLAAITAKTTLARKRLFATTAPAAEGARASRPAETKSLLLDVASFLLAQHESYSTNAIPVPAVSLPEAITNLLETAHPIVIRDLAKLQLAYYDCLDAQAEVAQRFKDIGMGAINPMRTALITDAFKQWEYETENPEYSFRPGLGYVRNPEPETPPPPSETIGLLKGVGVSMGDAKVDNVRLGLQEAVIDYKILKGLETVLASHFKASQPHPGAISARLYFDSASLGSSVIIENRLADSLRNCVIVIKGRRDARKMAEKIGQTAQGYVFTDMLLNTGLSASETDTAKMKIIEAQIPVHHRLFLEEFRPSDVLTMKTVQGLALNNFTNLTVALWSDQEITGEIPIANLREAKDQLAQEMGKRQLKMIQDEQQRHQPIIHPQPMQPPRYTTDPRNNPRLRGRARR